VPKFELTKLVSFLNSLNLISSTRNYIGPSISFKEDASATFSIGKNKYLPSSQLIINFNYSTNAFAGVFSPSIVIYLNNVLISAKTFSSSNGAKTVTIDINNTFLSSLNNSITDPSYDLITLAFTVPGSSSASVTTVSDIEIEWSTSKDEVFENYETFNGADLVTYSTYNSLPEIIDYEPVTAAESNTLVRESKYYKVSFSGIENEPFDLVSRAILRVTGSNNLSISGVQESPLAIEAYCVNRNISDLTEEYNTESENFIQEGSIYAWGTSETIFYSGNQSNDIELCFVQRNTSHPFSFPAKKYSRDHKSLFALGDFYLKGLSSGYEVTNLELILYENNDKYLPFSMIGGDSLYSNRIVTITPEGYVSSRKLMTKNLQFWDCSSGVSGSGEEEAPPPP
jgi:hypothetical protein